MPMSFQLLECFVTYNLFISEWTVFSKYASKLNSGSAYCRPCHRQALEAIVIRRQHASEITMFEWECHSKQFCKTSNAEQFMNRKVERYLTTQYLGNIFSAIIFYFLLFDYLLSTISTHPLSRISRRVHWNVAIMQQDIPEIRNIRATCLA